MKLDQTFGLGSRCGELVIQSVAFKKKTPWGSRTFYKCLCSCGKNSIHMRNILKRGAAISCGHLRGLGNISHGFTRHGIREPLYSVFSSMKNRCYNKNDRGYKNYGKRGIKIYKEWLKSYISFRDWSISNGYKKGLSIDRINNDGNYEPSNCRWSDRRTQNRNSRHCNWIIIDGEKKPLSSWIEDKRCPIVLGTYYQRIKKGWDNKQALLTPKLHR